MIDDTHRQRHFRNSQRKARRTIAILALALVISAVVLIGVIVGQRSQATEALPSRDDAMRTKMLELRSIIDRNAMANWFQYPSKNDIQPGSELAAREWPTDPWTGEPLSPGDSRGRYSYVPAKDRRSYQLVGYLSTDKIEMTGGMPSSMMLAYDHRGEEGLNLIRQYLEVHIRENGGVCPDPSEVFHGGGVGRRGKAYWPSNPWDHEDMKQRDDRGSFAYSVSADRRSYTLSLHRALKKDYVLTGPVSSQ